ncbi:hypothetical protein Hypma_014620 [Hypsizygus marmoreus]|uniref:Uncharacterized protein n=1 Tax=Hypsizygus marmoreus TaxID=39966 RepID=A0A369J9G4_HYPMA|nr:hypothetical protein Hypma_014620 [Hypsizygus marmoreus]
MEHHDEYKRIMFDQCALDTNSNLKDVNDIKLINSKCNDTSIALLTARSTTSVDAPGALFPGSHPRKLTSLQDTSGEVVAPSTSLEFFKLLLLIRASLHLDAIRTLMLVKHHLRLAQAAINRPYNPPSHTVQSPPSIYYGTVDG